MDEQNELPNEPKDTIKFTAYKVNFRTLEGDRMRVTFDTTLDVDNLTNITKLSAYKLLDVEMNVEVNLKS